VEDVVPREPLDAAQSVRWLLGIALVALAVGALALRRKQYELTA
jgi:hypothetical protein